MLRVFCRCAVLPVAELRDLPARCWGYLLVQPSILLNTDRDVTIVQNLVNSVNICQLAKGFAVKLIVTSIFVSSSLAVGAETNICLQSGLMKPSAAPFSNSAISGS